jgi:hypothetical protein
MPYLAASTDRRAISAMLSDADVARTARQAEEVDVSFGEAADLLPLDILVMLTERRRAA